MNKKLISIVKASVLVFLASVTASCNLVQKQAATSDAFEYPAEVRANDPITFRLADTVSFKGTAEMIAKNISITPKVGFDVQMLNSQTVSLIHKEPLAYNASYKVSVNLGKVSNAKLGTKSFKVKTLNPVFNYSCGKLSMYKDKEDQYYIKGSVETSEPIDSALIQKGMSVSASGVSVIWNHSKDGKSHSFTLHKIASSLDPYTLSIVFDYPAFDPSAPRKYEYNVPAKGMFIVIDEEIVTEPYHIEVAFSSALDKKQAFKDVVSAPNGGKLKFMVETNKLSIYPSKRAEDVQLLKISKLLKNSKGELLGEDWSKEFKIPSESPYVKFVSKGTILPSTNGMKVYFQSINYAKVEVRVKKIFENNILQYLQSSNLNQAEAYNIDQVAKIVADTTFALDEPSSLKLRNLNTYGLDVSELIKPSKGAVYKVEIRGVDKLAEIQGYYWESDYYFGSYSDYEQRTINILSSDLGIIAKGSDNGGYTFFVTDIITAKPVSGAKIWVYDRVNQLIGEGSTSGEGKCTLKFTDDKPFTAIATYGNDKVYIKMEEGLALSLSNFEVDGTAVKKGQKGFIFGERGVWRPGDDIYLTFISMLSDGMLPSGHPVTAVLKNPHDQVIQTIVNNKGSNGMYAFKFKTAQDAPTGNWTVSVTAGGQTYVKTVKIETVKPNKLKMDFSTDEEIMPASKMSGKMEVSWLTGNPGRNLKVTIGATITKGATAFKKYKDYSFEDDSRSFSSGNYTLATGQTDENGFYSFSSYFQDPSIFPGFMNMVLESTVYEPSGDFSTESYSRILSPYTKYVGIKVPEETNEWGGKFLDITKKHTFNLVAVNKEGNTVSSSKLEVEVYKMGWSWWWGSSSSQSLAMYSRDSYNKPYKILNVPLKGGVGSFELGFDKNESGFYFFRVVDPSGGHSASAVAMVQNNYSTELSGGSDGAARLQTSLDKEKYNAGETAQLTIPSTAGAQALVCLEKGEEMFKSFWIACTGDKTVIPIPLTGEMAPNIYASVTLVQPHNSSSNDAPIRMFGVQRILVEDPASHLYPVISVADEVRPESEVSISVSERDGRKMSYVIALVDEGLLNLTRFKTPDPWKAFYATEALGVRTWDLYNMVIGAYGAKMERLFAIGGGDDGLSSGPVSAKAQRFTPVSLFLGPFTIGANKTASHKIQIPPYIGSLRAMVVATDGRAQGFGEKDVAVRKPLMVQATLPRVIGTDEDVRVPVTVFAMKSGLGQVNVKLEVNDAFTIVGNSSQSVTVNAEGEEMVYFNIKASSVEGLGKLKVSASCTADNASEAIEIDVRDPNPYTSVSKVILLNGGEKSFIQFALAGRAGTNTAKIEASTLPPVDLDYRLDYLTEYQHSCIEQLVSCVFPFLYLSDLTEVSPEKAAESENSIKSAISRLPAFSTSSGGFTYWPQADSGISFWGTVYAAHFMICARQKGYAVPASLLKSALGYIRTRSAREDDSSLERAYAFYVLALGGEAPRGAMNRLRENAASLSIAAQWYLAAAYTADGKKDIASELVSRLSVASSSAVKSNAFSYSFDSKERVLSSAAFVYIALGESAKAFEAVRALSLLMNDRNYWMSTQSTAWALNAIAAYSAGQETSGVDVAVNAGDKIGKFELKGDKSFMQKEIKGVADIKGEGVLTLPLEIVNNTSSATYVVVSSKGVPEKGLERDVSNGLAITVSYQNAAGFPIDPSSLEQGTDFTIKVKVRNTNTLTDYTNLVLTQIFPSGWEYKRDRWDGYYQDFRDDRAYTYFNLRRGNEITFTTRASATYAGRFYLPSVSCEAMYDGAVNGAARGQWCEVR